jgi:hypothetical protein
VRRHVTAATLRLLKGDKSCRSRKDAKSATILTTNNSSKFL